MTLVAILMGTMLAGIGSVWLAAALSFGLLARHTENLLSLAAGALLGTAFVHLLPEAFEHAARPDTLFITLLIGVVFFFLLDKAELWHHGHEHHHDPAGHPVSAGVRDEGHGHDHDHDHRHAPGHLHEHAARNSGMPSPARPASQHAHHHHASRASGGWAVLAGDSVHCFGDGILIASAFMADLRLGAVAAVAVLVHEVPHHMGDLSVLRAASGTRQAALLKVTLAGAITALGGLIGWWLVDWLHEYLRYFLVVASSSFIYVALADLIPQLQKRLSLTETLVQVAWLLGGMALVTVASALGAAG